MLENLQTLCIDTAYACAVGVGVAVSAYGISQGAKLLVRNARKLAAVSLVGAILVGGMVVVGTDGAGTKPGTNDVSQVEGGTNAVTQIEGTNGTSSAAGPLMLGHFGRPNFAQGIPTTVTSDDIARLWRIAATTDAGLFAEPTANAVTNAAWIDYGGVSDSLRIRPEGWHFPYGDKTTAGLTVFQNGEFRPNVKTHFFPRPFDANLSLLPRMNWGLLPGGGESVFWHEQTPSNSLILAWHNALYNRDVNCPTNFQAELFADGRFDYRYPGRTIQYAPVFPFDFDDDGLENSVDPEPLVAGPDAHGTNAEWYNVVCSNVFIAVEGAQGVELAPRTVGVKTNAYYFVDVVAQRGPAPIYFNSSHPGRLGSPVVVAYGGVTNRVPLMVGATYSITSGVPFTVACPTNGFVEVARPDGRNAKICWPLEFTFTEGLAGVNRTYTVDVEPYNPGGSFEWRMENEELRMGAGEGGIFHSPLSILHLAGGACGCVSGNGNTVTFGCSSTCTCGGNCLAVGAFSFEYAVFAVTGGVCRCGFDDPPAPEQPTFGPLDEPTLSVSFSAPAIIFEDAYVDSPGVTRPRRSTRTRLTVSAWGGPNGGTMTLTSQNLGKLAPVACGPMALPPSVTLAPYQLWSVSYLCEGSEESSEVADVSVLGILLDSATSLAITGRTELTSVKVTFKPDYPVGNSINRHVIGVREAAKISWMPQALTLQVLTDGNGDIIHQNGKCNYRAPLITSTTNLIAKYGAVQFPIKIEVKEPERIIVRSVEVFDYGVPKGVAGGAGMELALYIYPTNVSFMGIAVQEVPSNYRDPWGYFLKEDFRDLWSHTYERSAGVWHDVGVGNLFMYDIAEMGDAYPGVRTDGTIGDIDDHAWIPGGMNWMIPVGWNENGSDENDVPVKIIETYWQRFRISALGTVEVEKLGNVVERGTNNEVRLNGIIQRREDLRPR